jgi:PHD/YefM family antitoxin component YafN of YafNO toxin-antitoxin module
VEEIARRMATLTSREFNHDVARAKRAANKGPVIITDRGRPAYVLMRHDAYQRLVDKGLGIRELLAHPESVDVAFEPPRLGSEPPQILDIE